MSMNATPPFNGTENEFLENVPLGTEVECNWGAMFATQRGTVIGYDAKDRMHHIDFGDGASGWHRIRATRSPNGSPDWSMVGMNTLHLMGYIAIGLAAWGTGASFLAWHFYVKMRDYKRANEIRAQAIAETRSGKPPFLLDPGVEIRQTDSDLLRPI
jgi:hypothetical protein